jgi:hypothetical protein
MSLEEEVRHHANHDCWQCAPECRENAAIIVLDLMEYTCTTVCEPQLGTSSKRLRLTYQLRRELP